MQSIKETLENVGDELIKEIRARLSSKNINNTGNAGKSLGLHATDSRLQIKGVRYIGALDVGRRPGKFPPVRAIRDWVAQKLGITGKENNSVAYLVGRKIAEQGTTIYQDNSRGIELQSIQQIGTRLIKKNVSGIILSGLKSKIMDLSKEQK